MNTDDLRDELLELDAVAPEMRETYERRLNEMLEHTLTRTQRVAWVLSSLLGLGLAITFATVALVSGGLPWHARLPFAAGAVFGLGWFGFAASIVRRGRVRLRTDARFAAGWVWAIVLIVFMFSTMSAGRIKDPVQATTMLVGALGYLLIGAVFLLKYAFEQGTLTLREELLRLRLELAERADKPGAEGRS